MKISRERSRECWGVRGRWEGWIYYLNLKYSPVANRFKFLPHLLAMKITRTGSDPFESHLFSLLFSTCAKIEMQSGQQARKTKMALGSGQPASLPITAPLKGKTDNWLQMKTLALPRAHQLLRVSKDTGHSYSLFCTMFFFFLPSLSFLAKAARFRFYS